MGLVISKGRLEIMGMPLLRICVALGFCLNDLIQLIGLRPIDVVADVVIVARYVRLTLYACYW